MVTLSNIELTSLVSFLVVVGGFLLNYLAHRRVTKKDHAEEIRFKAQMIASMDHMREDLAEVSAKQDRMHDKQDKLKDTVDARFAEITERTIILERDVRSAHRRIDELHTAVAETSKRSIKTEAALLGH